MNFRFYFSVIFSISKKKLNVPVSAQKSCGLFLQFQLKVNLEKLRQEQQPRISSGRRQSRAV